MLMDGSDSCRASAQKSSLKLPAGVHEKKDKPCESISDYNDGYLSK
jgi:hypothetical protein